MFTQNDLEAIGRLIDQKLDQKLEPLMEKIEHLPTKDEFYAEMLKLYKRQDELETEKDVLVSRSADNSSRIDLLEQIHPKGKHSKLQTL